MLGVGDRPLQGGWGPCKYLQFACSGCSGRCLEMTWPKTRGEGCVCLMLVAPHGKGVWRSQQLRKLDNASGWSGVNCCYPHHSGVARCRRHNTRRLVWQASGELHATTNMDSKCGRVHVAHVLRLVQSRTCVVVGISQPAGSVEAAPGSRSHQHTCPVHISVETLATVQYTSQSWRSQGVESLLCIQCMQVVSYAYIIQVVCISAWSLSGAGKRACHG